MGDHEGCEWLDNPPRNFTAAQFGEMYLRATADTAALRRAIAAGERPESGEYWVLEPLVLPPSITGGTSKLICAGDVLHIEWSEPRLMPDSALLLDGS